MQKVETIIIGAGLSGLMLGHRLQRDYLIIEAAADVASNLNAPFFLHAPVSWLPSRWKRIEVQQNAWDGERFYTSPDIKVMADYAKKITGGKIVTTSLIFMDGKNQAGYIPHNGRAGQIIKDLKDEVVDKILFGHKVLSIDVAAKEVVTNQGSFQYERLVSTMPMPVLLSMLGMKIDAEFHASPISMDTYEVPAGSANEVYQIIYISSGSFAPNKVALMDNRVFVESTVPMDDGENQSLIMRFWGLSSKQVESKVIRPGKFHPIDKSKRKALLAILTNKHDIYCLGRYAVWDYKRLDHVASDVDAILEMTRSRGEI